MGCDYFFYLCHSFVGYGFRTNTVFGNLSEEKDYMEEGVSSEKEKKTTKVYD